METTKVKLKINLELLVHVDVNTSEKELSVLELCIEKGNIGTFLVDAIQKHTFPEDINKHLTKSQIKNIKFLGSKTEIII